MNRTGEPNVNKAFQIFKRDLRRLLHNPVAMVITVGICIIPSLYAWYNIVANWDPYGNTAGVKIAVANEDAGTENEYVGSLNAGEQTVEKLRENHDLGWVFTSAEEAREGVERGDYYAAIVIPKDFSEKLTSMLTGTFEQPKLTYYVNEKKNAIAPKVTDTGAETIEDQLNETFVATVSETLAEKAAEAGTDLSAAVDRAHTGLLANVEDASSAIQKVRDALGGSTGTIDTTKQAVASADKTLKSLSEQTPALTDALAQGNTLLASTRASASAFGTSLSSVLSGGATKLASASSKANGAVGAITGAVAGAQTKVDLMLGDVQAVIDLNTDLLKKLGELNDAGLNIDAVTTLINELTAQNASLQKVKDGLQAQSDAIKNDADALASASSSVNTAVQGGVDTLNTAQQNVSSQVMPGLTSGLDAFSSVSGDLAGVVAGLDPTITQARGMLGQLTSVLDQAKSAISSADTSLQKLQDSLLNAATDIAALRGTEALGELSDLSSLDADEIADFMASPVTLATKAVYPVANYGSGVAPFYTNLALWVGGFVLIAIIKLEVDTEGVGAFTAAQGYFGRWMLLVLLGVVQALIVCAGDLALGIQCAQPALFVLAGVLISFVYVNIIYALAIAFKHIGKAIAVILVIMQIPGSSGLYPIEMMPTFFQGLHPLLPFTYGIAAMRETVGGMYGAAYAANLGVLLIYVVLALVVGVALRPLLLNLNLLFDRHLSRTGVMICEENDLPRERFSLRTTVRALLDAKSFRADLVERAARFEHRYPYLIKVGFALVFGLPVLLFILTAALDLDIDGKIVLLVLWIAAIIVADAYMIVVEYIRESLNAQMAAAALDDEALCAQMAERSALLRGAVRKPRAAKCGAKAVDAGRGSGPREAAGAQRGTEAAQHGPAAASHEATGAHEAEDARTPAPVRDVAPAAHAPASTTHEAESAKGGDEA